MRCLFGAALLVVVSTSAWAQEPVTRNLPAVAWPAPTTNEQSARKVTDKKFWLLGAALGGSMALDTKSTFDVDDRCARCVETNPYAAPFVNRGPVVAFTAGGAFDVGVMALAAKMRTAQRPQVRKIWWVVPVALTTGHLIAWNHNAHVAK